MRNRASHHSILPARAILLGPAEAAAIRQFLSLFPCFFGGVGVQFVAKLGEMPQCHRHQAIHIAVPARVGGRSLPGAAQFGDRFVEQLSRFGPAILPNEERRDPVAGEGLLGDNRRRAEIGVIRRRGEFGNRTAIGLFRAAGVSGA